MFDTLESPQVAGLLVIGALALLVALRQSFGGVTVRIAS